MNDSPTRVRLRPVFVGLAVGYVSVFLLLPLVAAVLVLIFATVAVSVWIALGLVAYVAVLGYAMSSSVQWVELDGGVIRWRVFLTRQVKVRPVADLVDALPLHSNLMSPLENAVMDFMLRTTNRGFEFRFRDGTKLGLVRDDMAGLDQFLGALAYELARQNGRLGGRRRDGPRLAHSCYAPDPLREVWPCFILSIRVNTIGIPRGDRVGCGGSSQASSSRPWCAAGSPPHPCGPASVRRRRRRRQTSGPAGWFAAGCTSRPGWRLGG